MGTAQKVVSSEAEELILVDVDDNEIGHLSKARCHDGDGVLHRAFSLFLFNGCGELLLQQRARSKRLWGSYWSNSCCSHPRRGESMAVATRRRLREELNVDTELEHVYKFQYQASFGDTGAEHELCHVYLGRLFDGVRPNENEIESIRWICGSAIEEELRLEPQRFSPWFNLEWCALRDEYADELARYMQPLP